jgi:hypothetical protein
MIVNIEIEYSCQNQTFLRKQKTSIYLYRYHFTSQYQKTKVELKELICKLSSQARPQDFF